ncbi:MAG: arginine repressor [Gammaproteobacteria bacterium RIFCSPHIGHO2_12_FULL_37_34]|nr:MAG: arginine repressor [Gammaproteobacteria bacterium RIFCSPHIGHO2_12_FULL_37_34]
MSQKTNHKKIDLIVAIQNLLQKKMVRTQDEIREVLHKQGFDINQAMISRILHKLGAIKMNEGEQIVYRLPTELIAITPKDQLKQLVLNIAHNEALIVIQTSPGSAQLVARLLDQKNVSGILGTLAGDDTIFIAPDKIRHIDTLYQSIREILLV